MFNHKNNLTQKEEEEPSQFFKDKLIFKKYKIVNLIADGTFGQIYLVVNNKNEKFAMKTEKKESKYHLLEQEGYHLFSLKGLGIPKIISFGKLKNYTILIEEFLGQSLQNFLLYNTDKLTIRDKCLISIQLIERIKYLHSKTLIHRDIKPSNFLFGLNDPNVIYLTEFRFCSKYKSSKTGKHIIPGVKGTFTGSLKFSSANAQRGMQQSRRDDLESLGYTILFLFKGKLPWEMDNYDDLSLSEKEIYLKTYKMKKFMPTDKLCKGCPNELVDYFKYVRALKFEEEPNYNFLKNLFINLIKKEIDFIDDIETLNFGWINPHRDNSKSRSKKKAGVKARLYHKIIENFQNKKSGRGLNLESISPDINNSIENLQNIMKKSVDIDKNYTILNSMTQNNENNLENLNNINLSKNHVHNNSKKNLRENMKEDQKIKFTKEINLKNNILTNRENGNYKTINNKIKYNIPNGPNINLNERNYINNNIIMNNYYKIDNNPISNNIKRKINNNIKISKQEPNSSRAQNKINNQQIYTINNINQNISQNMRQISNNLNKGNIRSAFTLNKNNKINLTATNLENNYKNDLLSNKIKRMRINNIKIGNQNNLYNYNNNRIFDNKNFNLQNMKYNRLLNKYNTYSIEKNNINATANTFNNEKIGI